MRPLWKVTLAYEASRIVIAGENQFQTGLRLVDHRRRGCFGSKDAARRVALPRRYRPNSKTCYPRIRDSAAIHQQSGKAANPPLWRYPNLCTV